MRKRDAAVVAGLALGFISGTAQAAYIVNVKQVGRNVVATGSGSLNLSGLRYNRTIDPLGSGTTPALGVFYLGQGTSIDLFDGVSGPASFGPSPGAFADLALGKYVGIVGSESQLFISSGYQSGSDLGTSNDVFKSTTIEQLGLTPGTYTYHLGSFPISTFGSVNVAADTFTINVSNSVSSVPLPASAPLFGTALLGLAGLGSMAKRKKKAADA